jgi:two-component system sensor histidine kinase TctE
MAEAAAPSLRRRLLAWLVLATLAIGVLALVDTRAEALRTARDVSDRVLAGSALAIGNGVSVDAEGGLSVAIPFSALEMLSSPAQDQVFYRVDGPSGLLTGYDDLRPAPIPDGAESGFADDLLRGTAIRKASVLREVTSGEGLFPVVVTVAESTRARENLAQSILARSALRIAVLIAGAAGVTWLATTMALRPMDRLSRAIADRAPHDLSPVEARAPGELQPVLRALNGFLLRLQKAVAALQNFAGNANHQIRTPLTVARTQLAVARREAGGGASSEALAKADAALVRTERVLEQLLLLARVQATGLRPGALPTNVAAVARGVVEDLLPLAIRQGMDLGYDGPALVMAPSEEVLLGEMLRNLAGNALAHCPAGTAVTVRVEPLPAHVRLRVTDNGPALDDEAFERLRGRLTAPEPDGRIRSGTRGLGLFIVKEIAQTLNTGLAVARGEGGAGLEITLDLPQQQTVSTAGQI